MNKRKLYKVFLDRMAASTAAGTSFEASWYAYAVLEDRLISMLRQSGGTTTAKGKPIQPMGPKLTTLKKRAANDAVLAGNFEHDRLWKWKCDRDTLMHGMADGSLSVEQIDAMVAALATGGERLAREYAAAAMRIKKQQKKNKKSATTPNRA